MVRSFDRFVPSSVLLYVYNEDFAPEYHSERVVYRNLHQHCPELVAFKQRHKNNPVAHGSSKRSRFEITVRRPRFKVKVRRVEWGAGFRWDAVRFSHKIFAIAHAAENCEADVLFWVDADIVFNSNLDEGVLESLLPTGCFLSYLRRWKYSECGFVGYNLRHPATLQFLKEFTSLYSTDTVFKKREYHDSFLFDLLRRKYERAGFATHDIADGAGLLNGEVLTHSVLGNYMCHLKGERKGSLSALPVELLPQKV